MTLAPKPHHMIVTRPYTFFSTERGKKAARQKKRISLGIRIQEMP